jgi:hypothetical protein
MRDEGVLRHVPLITGPERFIQASSVSTALIVTCSHTPCGTRMYKQIGAVWASAAAHFYCDISLIREDHKPSFGSRSELSPRGSLAAYTYT